MRAGAGYADESPVRGQGRAPGVRHQGAQAGRASQEPRHEAQQVHPQVHRQEAAKEG